MCIYDMKEIRDLIKDSISYHDKGLREFGRFKSKKALIQIEELIFINERRRKCNSIKVIK